MKKISLTVVLVTIVLALSAQDSTDRKSPKNDKKEGRRQKVNNLIKQAEEGVLVYRKQSVFGVQGRTNGYGIFYELGRMQTNRKTTIYRIDLTEIKHAKEEKSSNAGFFFGNPFIYGKINNFYQLSLGFGQQYILGQKGNKNGVAVTAVYSGGLALGLLKPYYLEVEDPLGGDNKIIKYSEDTKAVFLGPTIIGAGGFGKGWNELKIKPGGFAKTALRFDYGRFNEVVSGIEVGLSLEFYGSKIPIMAEQKDKQMFFQGYIALLFGRRK
ncbi:MAG: hypothetical protein ABIR30_12765 [Chitinophagaceae bacterium]